MRSFSNLCASPNIVRMVKSRRMRWLVHVAHIGDTRNENDTLVRKPEGKRALERL
jgi:hypothetical protein